MSDILSINNVFSPSDQIATLTYKQQAYKLIKTAILYQKMKTDTIYSQDSICHALNISRTPVREAFLELQNEGYVNFYRGKGIKVVSLDPALVHDFLEMRMDQEMMSAELAARRASQEDLDLISSAMQEHFQSLALHDQDLCYRTDHQFHRAIAKAAHNGVLYQSLDNLLDQCLRTEFLHTYHIQESINATFEEHKNIFQAVSSHDQQKARLAAKYHLENAYRRAQATYWYDD